MRRLEAGVATGVTDDSPSEELAPLEESWQRVIEGLLEGRPLRPVQRDALLRDRILESRRNVVIAAPTNSGKSLLGHLILIEAVLKGRRAVLLEPLRALAQEQADNIRESLTRLAPGVFARTPQVRVCTGDYRQEDELPSDTPDSRGEIVVATPERLDAILRNPANASWVSSIGALVVDEAHLLADSRRGPTLELVVATFLSAPSPPRMCLLSATIGSPERVRDWLSPCSLVSSTARTPMEREVWVVGRTEEADSVVASGVKEALGTDGSAVLVFVYRRGAADALARKLSAELGVAADGYHSGLSAAQRTVIRGRFRDGTCRVLIATTALAMGVNLPATHVIVRDTTFFGSGSLRVDELLQILGRAGRGDRKGLGSVVIRPTDDWNAEELAVALKGEVLPPLRSAFEFEQAWRPRREADANLEMAAATLVATCINRCGENGATMAEIHRLLGNTLGARSLSLLLDGATRWLMDPCRALAFRDDEGRLRLTVLGNTGIRSMLPLGYLGGLGQLIRDLISLDITGRLLTRWSSLDHLFLIALASDRGWKPRRFSEDLVDRVDSWLEARPVGEKSLLFADWVSGTAASSKADELFGSLGLTDRLGSRGLRTNAWRSGYVAMVSAVLLEERSRGATVLELERRWGVPNFDGSEEAWRDSAMWMLSGHASVCDVRGFYHHLRENCSASPEQVQGVKRALRQMRHEAYDAVERLKYCSPLGPLMRGVRDMLRASSEPAVGVGTVRALEANGVTTLQQVAQMDVDALVAAGVQRRFAKQLRAYIRKRMR